VTIRVVNLINDYIIITLATFQVQIVAAMDCPQASARTLS